MHIDPVRFYTPSDPELRQVAARQTLARWRHEGRGPAYHKSGSRVLYRGADILAWLDARRVTPLAEG
ncbi:helix-turn-helix transcriptional regulator [Rhodovulum sp. DZ06]|uniref:helix-turn-helix transcriptional regulator n=1 Tax=Rhodovulum sp. DZ06 TaxID=3425126 RepID=UPI003D34CD0C